MSLQQLTAFLSDPSSLDLDQLEPQQQCYILEIDFALKCAGGVSLEEHLRNHPGLKSNPEAMLKLILLEMHQQEGRGNPVQIENYQKSYPELSDTLMAVHQYQQSRRAEASLPESSTPPTVQYQSGSLPSRSETAETKTATSAQADTLGIPGYHMEKKLGQGGMGVVHKAYQPALNRHVALKMILHAENASEEQKKRFKREARAVAQLHHPNIVQIYEQGEQDGKPYFTLEYIEGQSLAQKLNGAPLPPLEGAALVEQMAQAMSAAHQAGVIHRDLKPGNVLLTEHGIPKITDFGLARQLDEASQTQTGDVLGTPSYMAPEQAQGRSHSSGYRVDIYALGAILYECLTGRPPFMAATTMETLSQVIHQLPVPPSRLQPGVPKDIETICLQCLEKDPQKRYSTSAALAEDLKRYQEGRPIMARPVGRLTHLWRWAGRNPGISALLLLVLLTLTGGALVASLFAIEARAEAQRADRSSQQANKEKGRAKQKAEEAQLSAIRARDAQALATRRAEDYRQEKTRAEWLLYANQLKLAEQYWQTGATRASRNSLLQSRPDFQNWEHDYLSHVLHREHNIQGHEKSVKSIAVSPDGQWFATTSADRMVKLWSTATGKLQRTFTGHQRTVFTVVFSPNGQHLASCDEKGTVRCWRVESGKPAFTFKGPAQPIYAIAYSPDGQWLASVGSEKAIRILNARTGRTARRFQGHRLPTFAVAFSPNGKTIATASSDHSIKLWSPVTGQLIRVITGHTGTVASLAFSPNGQSLVSGSHDHTLRIHDLQTGKTAQVLQGHTDHVYHVSISPNGRWIASASADRMVKLWDYHTGKTVQNLQGHTTTAYATAFTPSGHRLITGSYNGSLKVWSPFDPGPVRSLRSPRRWALTTAFHPKGKTMASAGAGGAIRIWSVDEPRQLFELTGHTMGINDLSYSPNGILLASSSYDRTIKIWDLSTRKLLQNYQGHADRCNAVSFSPDGQWLASASDDKTIRVWHHITGEERAVCTGHARGVTDIAFSPNGKRIVSSSWDRTVRIWDSHTGQELSVIRGHQSSVHAVAYSPNGKWLASGSDDKTVRLWDAGTGEELFTLKGHTGRLNSVTFSPDNQRLVSAGSDKTIVLWSTSSGKSLFLFQDHLRSINCVTFSPDGRHLASASSDQTVRIRSARAPQHGPLASPPHGLWHQNQALEARKSGREEAELFHLRQAVKLQPWRADLQVSIAFVQRQKKRHQSALQHYLTAWMLNQKISFWPEDRFAKARGEIAAANQQWHLAAHGFAMAIRQPGATLSEWQSLLLSQAATGSLEDYQSHCNEMWDRYASSEDPTQWLPECLLAPGDLGPLLMEPAQKMLQANPRAQGQQTLAIAWYRNGQYAESELWLQKAVASPDLRYQGITLLFLAMACHQQRRYEEAEQWMEQARLWKQDTILRNWKEIARWKIYFNEAEETLKTYPKMPLAGSKP